MQKALFGVALALAATAATAACGGGGKDAESPGTCPEGTVLKGSDCLPAEAAGDTSGGDDAPKKPAHKKKADDDDAPKGDTSSSGSSDTGGGGGGSGGYDKDAVEAQMKRATKQIKSNCGSATDDEGKATGPWGTVSANIVLGRNGHIKDVTVPDPYNGKPVGICVVRALQKIQFPPYAGSSDVSISRDFEVVKPK